jgi:hypothetical protein
MAAEETIGNTHDLHAVITEKAIRIHVAQLDWGKNSRKICDVSKSCQDTNQNIESNF